MKSKVVIIISESGKIDKFIFQFYNNTSLL